MFVENAISVIEQYSRSTARENPVRNNRRWRAVTAKRSRTKHWTRPSNRLFEQLICRRTTDRVEYSVRLPYNTFGVRFCINSWRAARTSGSLGRENVYKTDCNAGAVENVAALFRRGTPRIGRK